MDHSSGKDLTIHISSKSHLNLTFNLYQCGRRTLLPGAQLALGASDAFTMVYVYEGSASLEVNRLVHAVHGSTGFFAFPDTDYSIKNAGTEPLMFVWLNLSGYYVESYLNRAGIYRSAPTFGDDEGYIGRQFQSIYTASQKMPNRYCRMMSLLYDIFGFLIDMNPGGQTDNYVDNADYYAVRAVDYIEHNYDKNISVGDIAAALGISRKHLYTVFNDILKIPPRQYLIYYRIEKACLRLKASSDTIQTIAESVGYASQFYFAKEFRRLMGVTPSHYRQKPHPGEIFTYRLYEPMLRAVHPDYAMHVSKEGDIFSDMEADGSASDTDG